MPKRVNVAALALMLQRDDLGAGIRGQDGLRGRLKAALSGGELVVDLRQSFLEPIHGELVADDARRGDQNLLGPTCQEISRHLGGPRDVGRALRARGRVGIAGVDHNGPDVIGRQVLAAPPHGRRTDPVGGERTRRRARTIGDQQREVKPSGRLDPGLHRPCPEPAGNDQILGTLHSSRSPVSGSSDFTRSPSA